MSLPCTPVQYAALVQGGADSTAVTTADHLHCLNSGSYSLLCSTHLHQNWHFPQNSEGFHLSVYLHSVALRADCGQSTGRVALIHPRPCMPKMSLSAEEGSAGGRSRAAARKTKEKARERLEIPSESTIGDSTPPASQYLPCAMRSSSGCTAYVMNRHTCMSPLSQHECSPLVIEHAIRLL